MSDRTHPKGSPDVPLGKSALDGQTKDLPKALSFDEFVERLGGWGVLLAMYLSLGGAIAGLPRPVQQFLAKRLEEAKQAKAAAAPAQEASPDV